MEALERVQRSVQGGDGPRHDRESGVIPADAGLDSVCDDEIETVEAILDGYPARTESIIPALQDVQDEYGYIPRFAMELIASECDSTMAHVYGTTSFYSQFYLEPRGDHTIKVCTGTACHVQGADEVSESFCDELDVDLEEITEDGTFTVSHVRCIGACSLAVAVMVGDEVYGDVEPDGVDDIIEEYRDS
ncbi:NADH-quinone oxidoreductase subunit NuoE family protein [Halococcoides cellulosivorans]|uniref:NAD(P)H-dependent oxidoreductase subunit E n=1 Tax=Halococcoides cellulosivorans TaxID=1679096 RepID=A0A2R4WY15_9EURY|nr:NAD(P)H-dependent oxidoreductase subunit E [Halococcoides cellulosivorans]AWB26435.1 NAD(P)H-dependent oxidoreductase subunit E [Halococcoides cellulosivorans]